MRSKNIHIMNIHQFPHLAYLGFFNHSDSSHSSQTEKYGNISYQKRYFEHLKSRHAHNGKRIVLSKMKEEMETNRESWLNISWNDHRFSYD